MFKEGSISNDHEKKENEMKNTAEFRSALEAGKLNEAEDFLNSVANNPDKFPQYDDRWLDHRQRELFQEFYKIKDWQGAKRVIKATKDQLSKSGSTARLEELSGMKYDEI